MQRAVGAWSALVAGCLAASLSGCGATAAPVTASIRPLAASADPTAENGETAIDREFARRLLEIADEYAEYTLVDRKSRIANGACFVPESEFIPPQFSEAEEHAAHSKKLYFLFARDATTYAAAGADGVQPVGQAIVKESWAAREIHGSHRPAPFEHHSGLPVRLYAERGDRAFGADRQTELFIMFKLPPDAPGTDSGWVYGTVTADRQRVTSAGRIASCADCHRQSPGDRLFGIESQELASQPASQSDMLSGSENRAL